MAIFPSRAVLMADGNIRRRHLRRKILSELGCPVIEAGTCREAVQAVRERRPFLLVLGGRFGDGRPEDICRQIRTDAAAAPWILYLSERNDGAAVSAADGYLVEPVKQAELISYAKLIHRLGEGLAVGHPLGSEGRCLREWVEALPVAAYATDAEGRLALYNEAAAALWGRRPRAGTDQWCGSQAMYLPNGTPLPHALCPMAVALREQRPVRGQRIVIERPDGGRVAVLPYPTPLRDGSGALIGALNILLEADPDRVAPSARFWATVAEHTADGIVVTDAEGTIVAANPAFLRITDHAEPEVLGQNLLRPQTGLGDLAFFKEAWDGLDGGGTWLGEVWTRTGTGLLSPRWLVINAVKDEGGQVLNYIGTLTDMAPVKQSLERLEYLAHHDPLTGLPNRLLFRARLAHALIQAKRLRQQVAVMFVDLDHFKQINDGLGHAVGDGLLQAVAVRLTEQMREQDTVARYGGDEFVVLLEELAKEAGIANVAEKISKAMAQPFQVEGHSLNATASIGIGLYPRDGWTVDALLKSADSAMYRAKAEGRNTFRYHSGEVSARVFERKMVEGQLRRAIERDELVLHYQPQVELAGGRVAGLEVLVRWQHPEQGLILPERFLPLATEAGLLEALSDWVLRRACVQARAWLDQGLDFGRIAVNVSGVQLQRGTLARAVRSALGHSGLSPKRLALEIPESQIMAQGEPGLAQLAVLADLGVELAIDQFGMRHAALPHLMRLPVSTLKLDPMGDPQADPQDAAQVRALIALAHSLRLKVAAAGVEREGQRHFLAEQRCDSAQGFLFARPLPAQAVAGFLAG